MVFGSRGRTALLVLLPIILVLCLTSTNILPVAEAIWVTIPSSGIKCVSEVLQRDVVVLAEYYVFDDNHPGNFPGISARVTSPKGNNLYHIENATHGNFAFTTSEPGNYLACFWRQASHRQEAELTLDLEWKIGIAAKDWESVAKKEKIEGVELALRRLQGTVEAIHGKLILSQVQGSRDEGCQ
ncbi:hypothetical protein PTKIN_Ptkin01aG0029300 [Pterospermum kingtungense]